MQVSPGPPGSFTARLRNPLHDPFLLALFQELNASHFANVLPLPRVLQWSRTTRAGGTFSWSPSKGTAIHISRKHHVEHGWDLTRGIMLHEMSHFRQYLETGRTKDRDAQFQAMLRAVEAPAYVERLPATTEHFCYIYQCPSCGERFGYQRVLKRWRYHKSCGKQSRLQLVEYREDKA